MYNCHVHLGSFSHHFHPVIVYDLRYLTVHVHERLGVGRGEFPDHKRAFQPTKSSFSRLGMPSGSTFCIIRRALSKHWVPLWVLGLVQRILNFVMYHILLVSPL